MAAHHEPHLMARLRARITPVCVVIALVLSAFALNQTVNAQSAATLTNEDVVKMVRAELATNIILTAIDGSNATFDVSPAGLIALKEAGVGGEVIRAMQIRMRELAREPATGVLPGSAPEKSEPLATAKDSADVLRNFRTMFVDASKAVYFGSDQMKAALGKNKDFAPLRITVVNDSALADVVLNVGYTFAWDYPFTLTHQNTTVVLLSGKGSGPLSGPKGASSVAAQLVKLLRPYRIPGSPGTD